MCHCAYTANMQGLVSARRFSWPHGAITVEVDGQRMGKMHTGQKQGADETLTQFEAAIGICTRRDVAPHSAGLLERCPA